MLKNLEIENFAIIKNLKLEFNKSLNVFTGETGTGKTIIIEALSIVLGEKAGMEAIRSGEKKAMVSALFDVSRDKQTHNHLKDSMNIDIDDGEILLQREISSGRRGNCYFNNKLITLSKLRDIGNILIDIHGQHEHQSLLNMSHHIDLLDRFGGIYRQQKSMTTRYNELKQKERKLKELYALEENKDGMKDLLQFQVNEITAAHLAEDVDSKIEEERSLLANALKPYC